METMLHLGNDSGDHYCPLPDDFDYEIYAHKPGHIQVVNLLKEIERVLVENNQHLEHVITVIDRRYNVTMPFSLAKTDCDRDFNLTDNPGYEEHEVDNDYPILNPHVVFLLNQGQFIDVHIDHQFNYDGGRQLFSLRYNDFRPSSRLDKENHP